MFQATKIVNEICKHRVYNEEDENDNIDDCDDIDDEPLKHKCKSYPMSLMENSRVFLKIPPPPSTPYQKKIPPQVKPRNKTNVIITKRDNPLQRLDNIKMILEPMLIQFNKSLDEQESHISEMRQTLHNILNAIQNT
jgi:hypothetical protein